MDLGIRGRVAVVTGGDSGMGLATARFLLQAGARVLITDRVASALDKAAALIAGEAREGGEIATQAADLTDPDGAETVRQAVEARFGPADILVHAAGITGAQGDFLTIDDAGWHEAIETDLMTAVRVARAFIPGMRKAGWGRVVLFSSEDAVQPYVEELPYCAAKAAVLTLSKGLSKAYGRDGVLVNAVMPAFVATPMTDAMMEKRSKEKHESFKGAIQSFLTEQRPGIVVARRGEADEVAAAVAFLCSAHASYITGAALRVDGGSVATVAG